MKYVSLSQVFILTPLICLSNIKPVEAKKHRHGRSLWSKVALYS